MYYACANNYLWPVQHPLYSNPFAPHSRIRYLNSGMDWWNAIEIKIIINTMIKILLELAESMSSILLHPWFCIFDLLYPWIYLFDLLHPSQYMQACIFAPLSLQLWPFALLSWYLSNIHIKLHIWVWILIIICHVWIAIAVADDKIPHLSSSCSIPAWLLHVWHLSLIVTVHKKTMHNALDINLPYRPKQLPMVITIDFHFFV